MQQAERNYSVFFMSSFAMKKNEKEKDRGKWFGD